MSYERTVLVKEPNPEGDALFELAFANLRAERAAASERERDAAAQIAALGDDEEEDGAVTILVPGHEVSEGWPKALGTWRKRCLENDWQIKVGYAQARIEDVYYADAAKGVKKPAHVVEQWWLNATDGTEYLTISYTQVDGKTKRSSRAARSIDGLLSDAEMQKVVKHELDSTPGD